MKYNINRNQPPLTDGELSSARNFNNIFKGYNAMKIPFYRSGRLLTGGSAIIVAAAVALIVLFDDKTETPVTRFISPPIAQATIPIDSFTVDADSTANIDYKSGSKLHIPAGAFRDAYGNLIKGKVVLSYREFHDEKDIFLSGIPMTYDSVGVKYVFESAGMMEISATQNGKSLTANTDKPIKVDMVSNTKEDRYNTYYLDTVSKKWINLNQANLDPAQFEKNRWGKDTLVEIAQEPPGGPYHDAAMDKCVLQMTKTEAAVKAIEKEKPMPLPKADKSRSKFHIDIDPKEFPEIAMYKGVRFQVKDEAHFDKSSTKIQWEDVKLKKLAGMDYEVTFTKGSQTFKVVATPVIDDQNLAEAQKVYDKKFADYQAKLTARKEAEEKAQKEYEARTKEMEAEMQKAIAEQKVRDSTYEMHISKTELVYRTFIVNRFGIYNCDCPWKWPYETNVVASFCSENGEKLNLTCLNLVEIGRNIIFPYQPVNGVCRQFDFNATRNNMLWAITEDGKLAVVDKENFRAQLNETGKIQFRFKVIDKDFKSSDEVKKYLEI
jgi:hypothetical protein